MAPPLAISDPEIGAPAEQGPGTQQTTTVSSSTTAVSPHPFAVDDSRYPPDVAQAQLEPGQLGESDFPNGSGYGSLFSMYLKRAEEDDKKTAEGWKRDADGVLAFSGCFSVAVAVLLAVTVRDIRPDSQDTSAYYLANIFQQLNGTRVPSLPNPAAQFTPPTWAVWVNGLWFMGLVISLTCAVLATLLRQWARRYLRVAYPRCGPHKRARIRAFYANGVDKLHLQKVVEVLPLLLHISLFLFLTGVAVFLFNVNISIFKAVVAWVGICVLLYSYITILPILRKDSPYSTPLSGLASLCFNGIRSTFFRLLERFPDLHNHFPSLNRFRNHYPRTARLGDFFSHSMRKTAEQFAVQLGPETDFDSLMWTFESLDEDKELEQFFEGVPGLCLSKEVANGPGFIKANEKKFSNALIALMDRTLSSNLVPEAVKVRRIMICTKVVDATSLLGPCWILHRVLLGEWQKFLECTEFGLFVQNWKNITHSVTRFYAQCVAAATISSVPIQERDDRWFQLASGPLGTYKDLFQNYLKHGDNILLANAISILRQTTQTYSGSVERHRSDILGASSKALESLRKLDHTRTFPDLQHEFCGVWNQLVNLAKNDNRPYIVCVSKSALKDIRKLYIGLHKGTTASPMAFSNATDDSDPVLDDARSYCKCDLAEHRPSQPVPDLIIEEPVPGVETNAPSTPAVGTMPATPPVRQIVPSPLTAGVSNWGALSTSAINFAPSSSLDHIFTSPV